MYYITIYKYIYVQLFSYYLHRNTKTTHRFLFFLRFFFQWVRFPRHMQAPTIPPWRLVSLEAGQDSPFALGG